MLRSNWIVASAMILAVAFLCALGTWQVIRLNWKEGLIEQTQQRINQTPIDLHALELKWQQSGDVRYVPVYLEGAFQHDREFYYYNTHKGKAGWNVITPLSLDDQRQVLVNRGFVPLDLQEKSKRADSQIEGKTAITGLARNPVFDKPNRFIPDNNISRRELFWKDHKAMEQLSGVTTGKDILPFVIDLKSSNRPVRYPQAGTTRIDFPNNHLQYAITWFGLAAAALAVGFAFLMRGRKQRS